MTRIKDPSAAAAAEAELPWLRRYIPLMRRVAADLSRTTLRGRRIALNVHLDIKMVPVIEALVQSGAQVVVLGCNPHTTRDSVAALIAARGADVCAWAGMTEAEREEGLRWTLSQECEFVSEMGGELLETTVREGSAAGFGDPVDAFDLTSALMLAGIEFMVQRHAAFPAGIHLLPSEVQHRVAVLAVGPLSPSP